MYDKNMDFRNEPKEGKNFKIKIPNPNPLQI